MSQKLINNGTINNQMQKKDLLIHQIMVKYGYFPKTSFYDNNNNNQNIPENKNFQKLFPNLTTFFMNLDINFSEFIRKNEPDEKNSLNTRIRFFILNEISECNNEISSFIRNFWDSLNEKVKSHIILFLYMANEYITDKLNNYDKNILYWTILFHDIGKFHEMNKYYKEDYSNNKRKDKSHPFKSAIIFIQTLLDKELIYFSNENEKEKFIKFFEKEFTDAIYKSFEKEYNEYYPYPLFYNISFKNFENIEKFLLLLKAHEENKWIYDIIILIIFHQSLPNKDQDDCDVNHINKPLLDKKYIKKLFDVRLLELMRIILIYDSSNYCLFEGKWDQKIDKHFDLLINELFCK